MSLKASVRGRVAPFMVMDVMRAASDLEQQGRKIIHLEVGQPSTGVPQSIVEPLTRFIGVDPLGYTVANGIPELRNRISEHYRNNYAVKVSPEQIFVTTGSSAGFQLALLAAFDAGDRIAIASPGYPAYRHILTSLGLKPVLVPVGPETRYQPSAELLEDLEEEVDGLIVASPSNPTGTVIPRTDFLKLQAYCESKQIRLLSDEIYHGITYDGIEVTTAANEGGSSIVLNSFSKYFSMTGWRIGWMVVPPDLIRSIECLAQNHYISPPTLSQWAALHVFDASEELDANVERYAQNRAVLLKGLPQIGFNELAPSDGAFYLYANVDGLTEDSEFFCRAMLNDAGVAVTPGLDFDPQFGRQSIRLSFAGATKDIHEAIARLGEWLPTYQG